MDKKQLSLQGQASDSPFSMGLVNVGTNLWKEAITFKPVSSSQREKQIWLSNVGSDPLRRNTELDVLSLGGVNAPIPFFVTSPTVYPPFKLDRRLTPQNAVSSNLLFPLRSGSTSDASQTSSDSQSETAIQTDTQLSGKLVISPSTRNWSLLSGHKILELLNRRPDTGVPLPENVFAATQLTKDGWLDESPYRTIQFFPTGLLPESHENDSLLTKEYLRLIKRINLLCSSGEAYSPNDKALETALKALDYSFDLGFLPSLVNETGDKSILFEFFIDDSTFAIEFHNTGEVIFLENHRGEVPRVSEITATQVASTIEHISSVYDQSMR